MRTCDEKLSPEYRELQENTKLRSHDARCRRHRPPSTLPTLFFAPLSPSRSFPRLSVSVFHRLSLSHRITLVLASSSSSSDRANRRHRRCRYRRLRFASLFPFPRVGTNTYLHVRGCNSGPRRIVVLSNEVTIIPDLAPVGRPSPYAVATANLTPH